MRRPGIEPGPALWVIDYRLGHYPRPHRGLITMWEIPNEVHQILHYLKDKHGTIVCNNSVVYSPQLEYAMPLHPTVAVLVGL